MKDKLKAALSARGASGIASLHRVFRIMDDDGSKALSMSEFKKGLTEYKAELTDDEVRALFNAFDKDGNGQVSYEEFLVAIRGDLNSFRAQLVRQAFQKLDKTGNGIVDIDDLRGVFDPSKHPDVQDGKITPDQALVQVLDAFDQGDKDGKVTREEFEEYYKSLSAGIDRDEYFSQMIKTAWQLEAMPPPPPAYMKRKGVTSTLPVAGQSHGDILNWNQQPSELETRSGHRLEKRNYLAKDIHVTDINVMKWVDKEEGEKALKQEQNDLYGNKNKVGEGAANRSSTNILSWDKHQKSADPPVRPKKESDDYVWYAGHKKKTQDNNLHHSRPSPFGVDEEPTAFKLSQAEGGAVKPGMSTKKNIQSLAEMFKQ